MSDEEWRRFLRERDFGQLVAAGRGRDVPVIVPTHFAFDGQDTVLVHFATPNPVWEALAENPMAVLSVIDAYAYVPMEWNRGEDPPGYGVPTSYYAAVQAIGRCEVVDDPADLAALLDAQLAHFEPGEPHAPLEPGDNPYAKQFSAIRGVRLTLTDVRAKFKFGGNRRRDHNLTVADALRERGTPLDLEARRHLLRRRGVEEDTL